MPRSSFLFFLVCLVLSGACFGQDRAGIEHFESRIRPILVVRCYACHSAQSKPVQGGLRLDGRAFVLNGGSRGAALVPGKPDESLLMRAIRYGDHSLQMPPKGRIPQQEIDAIAAWIKSGAAMPEARADSKVAPFDLWKRAKALWSFQPIRRPAIPSIEVGQANDRGRGRGRARFEPAGPANPIDRFVLAKLHAAGFHPAPPAYRRTLIRRVTFDLIGLPPTPAEVEAFVSDRSPNAWEKVVDRLLASPHYGERWARHWLDIVRYAETCGHEFDFDKPGAFEYRDYVIRTLNADVPYNQFVMEHVAGDLLPNPRLNPVEGINESVIGTGFWQFTEGTQSPVDVRQDESDRIANQLDVFSKCFLGLSVGCARCHDHKFDPISTKDYYALAGYLRSSRYHSEDIRSPERSLGLVRDLEAINGKIREGIGAMLPALPAAESVPPNFTPIVDFHSQGFDGWFVNGQAFGHSPVPKANVRIDSQGNVAGLVAPGWADSGAISSTLRGVLRSSTFTIQKPAINFHVMGRSSRLRLIIDGFQLIQAPIYGGLEIYVKNERPAWVRMDLSKWVGQRAYIELIDDGDGFIALDRVVTSDAGMTPPSDSLDPTTELQDAERIQLQRHLNDLLAQRAAIEARIPNPRIALAMMDGNGWDEPVHVRGSYKMPGELAPRRFLEACGGAAMEPAGSGSGRLELARRLVAPSNPLLARVIVNRVWQHHFGQGIVRTPDDFGNMGQKPTHPELLDWLAAVFLENEKNEKNEKNEESHPSPHSYGCGWSLKKLHRLILTSQAYQMSSKGDSKADFADPQNKLLHKMPVRRLEAECIRDGILAVSGRLDQKMYGPGVMPYLTPQMEGRGRPKESGPMDGAGRRSIYLAVRRNFLNPMLLAFDFPVPFTCMGRRTVSNVPAQALTLMNNPLVVEQAGFWAGKLLSATDLTDEQRIRRAYETAFSRPPTSAEIESAQKFLASRSDAKSAWSAFCHVLFNVKEFIFIR